MGTKTITLPLLLASLLSAGCQGTGSDLFGSREQTQQIAANVSGTGAVQSIDLVPRSKGIGLGTLAGAAGGAYVGHEMEKRRKAGEIYKVTIKMDDGTTQSFAQENAPQLNPGDRVRITNGVLTKL